ncbi:MAG TPA: hypothetical protein VHJ38_07650 [Nitrososphaeraceae archaeon]|jgi:hypothetical protein|nr:hypothetical protein [Nitrososphaeraceae archaeon]
MKKSNINCKQWILKDNTHNFLLMSSLLALAFFMASFIYFSEGFQLVPATAQENQNIEQIVQQGIVTSTPDPLPGHEAHQSITILRLKEGNPTYQGTLTFTASQPVEVQILHRNMTEAAAVPIIPPEFGAMSILPLPGGNGQVVSSLVLPQYPEEATSFSASLPFAGNGLALHNLEGDEFVATYTVVADAVGSPQRADDIAIAAPETAADEEEEEDGDEEDN